jgi:hypothetical protein
MMSKHNNNLSLVDITSIASKIEKWDEIPVPERVPSTSAMIDLAPTNFEYHGAVSFIKGNGKYNMVLVLERDPSELGHYSATVTVNNTTIATMTNGDLKPVYESAKNKAHEQNTDLEAQLLKNVKEYISK